METALATTQRLGQFAAPADPEPLGLRSLRARSESRKAFVAEAGSEAAHLGQACGLCSLP